MMPRLAGHHLARCTVVDRFGHRSAVWGDPQDRDDRWGLSSLLPAWGAAREVEHHSCGVKLREASIAFDAGKHALGRPVFPESAIHFDAGISG